jgi:hypothetical protein
MVFTPRVLLRMTRRQLRLQLILQRVLKFRPSLRLPLVALIRVLLPENILLSYGCLLLVMCMMQLQFFMLAQVPQLEVMYLLELIDPKLWGRASRRQALSPSCRRGVRSNNGRSQGGDHSSQVGRRRNIADDTRVVVRRTCRGGGRRVVASAAAAVHSGQGTFRRASARAAGTVHGARCYTWGWNWRTHCHRRRDCQLFLRRILLF